MFEYFNGIYKILNEVEQKEKENIEKATEIFVEAIEKKHSIFVFGASHAGILSQELYYRAGGLMLINPIFAKELMLDNEPITHTSSMEKLVGYGKALAKKTPFTEKDVLLIHSVSGRNPVIIDMAISAKEKGVKIIGLTNLKYSHKVESRHPSNKKLYDLCDVVIDNHGDIGDAMIQIKNKQKVGPSSTVIGATILNEIIVETVKRLIKNGMKNPPIFYSANLDGGYKKNARLMRQYEGEIHYEY